MIGDRNDGIWLAWIDNRLATIGLYAQEIDGSGTRRLGDAGQLIVDQLAKPSHPQLVALGPGKVAIVWADRPKKDQWALSWAPVVAP